MKCKIESDGVLELLAETQEDADRIFDFQSQFRMGQGELTIAIPTEYIRKDMVYGGGDYDLDS